MAKVPKVLHRQDTYFIGSYTKFGKLKAIKIGTVARDQAVQRLRVLQTGSVDRLELLGVYNGAIEKKLHRQFKKSRLRPRSEFFRPTKQLLELIKNLMSINHYLLRLDSLEEPQHVVLPAAA